MPACLLAFVLAFLLAWWFGCLLAAHVVHAPPGELGGGRRRKGLNASLLGLVGLPVRMVAGVTAVVMVKARSINASKFVVVIYVAVDVVVIVIAISVVVIIVTVTAAAAPALICFICVFLVQF